MARSTRDIQRRLEQLGGGAGVDKDDLPRLSIAIILSAEEIRETDVDGVKAVDLRGDGDWQLHREMDLSPRTDDHGYQVEGPDE